MSQEQPNLPVLITGETGVGKELVARAIHDKSERRGKAMLCVNCGAIPESLIESTLFGHEKGAYTGATQRTKGVFEEADGGTVLLDEVGEISPTTQTALLRVLETKNICRLGSQRPVAVDVRVLAATNRDLEAMCEAGTFRLDLLFRLNAMTLRVPSLRERNDEVEALAKHFLEQANESSQCRVRGISRQVMTLLKQYNWPGNVRELRNVIDHAVVVAGEGDIGVEHLPGRILARAVGRTQFAPTPPLARVPAKTCVSEPPSGFKAHVRQIELALIGVALSACDWNKAEAARRLRIPLRTLKDKVRQGELARGDFDETQGQQTIEAFERVVGRAPPAVGDDEGPSSFKDGIRRFEEVLIREALDDCDWNKSEASRRLCIPLRTLKDKLAAYKIIRDDKEDQPIGTGSGDGLR